MFTVKPNLRQQNILNKKKTLDEFKEKTDPTQEEIRRIRKALTTDPRDCH